MRFTVYIVYVVYINVKYLKNNTLKRNNKIFSIFIKNNFYYLFIRCTFTPELKTDIMKKLIIIIAAIILTSCSTDDLIENEMLNEPTIENLSEVLPGQWSAEETDFKITFDPSTVKYDIDGTTEGVYDYEIIENGILVHFENISLVHFENISLEREILLSNGGNTLKYSCMTFNRQ